MNTVPQLSVPKTELNMYICFPLLEYETKMRSNAYLCLGLLVFPSYIVVILLQVRHSYMASDQSLILVSVMQTTCLAATFHFASPEQDNMGLNKVSTLFGRLSPICTAASAQFNCGKFAICWTLASYEALNDVPVDNQNHAGLAATG